MTRPAASYPVISGLRRTATVAATAAALVISLAGCGLLKADDPPPRTERVARTGQLTIGFSPINLSSPLLVDLGKGLETYAATKGATVISADPGNDAATQVRQLENWIDRGVVQAVWAIAVNAAALRPVFDKARQKGIAVLATGTPQDYGETTLTANRSYSFIDYRAYGRETGKALGACVKERLSGRARVLHAESPPGQVGVADYAAGLREGLTATAPGASIVATVDSRSDAVVSAEAIGKAMREDRTINAVVGANEAALSGAQRAYAEEGRKASASCVVGSGGNDASLAAVRAGTVYAVVALQYKEDLQQNVDQMLAMVADPRALGLQLLTPIETVRR